MDATQPLGTVQILLIEDNPGDVRLTREALAEASVANTLHVVGDGVDALAWLRKEGEYAGTPLPDLIVLDLNLPRMNGRQVLREIKSDPALRRIPVVVLTTSQAGEDVQSSYDLYANCFITKPSGFEQFITVVKSIESFWFSTVRLPGRGT